MENILVPELCLPKSEVSTFIQSQTWDYFLTVTFREDRRDDYAAIRDVWHTLHWRGEVKRAFLASESFRARRELHVHGLCTENHRNPFIKMANSQYLWHTLFHTFGRSKIEAIQNSEDVSNYCAKYVSKGLLYYGFFGRQRFWGGNPLESGPVGNPAA